MDKVTVRRKRLVKHGPFIVPGLWQFSNKLAGDGGAKEAKVEDPNKQIIFRGAASLIEYDRP